MVPIMGRVLSLKAFNVSVLVKKKIEMRKRNNNRSINLRQGYNILHILHCTLPHPKLYIKGIIHFSIIVVLSCMFPSNLHARMSIGGN